MAPPTTPFPASELPARVQTGPDGRRRKLPGGAAAVDLSACELLRMLQYDCEIENPAVPESPVRCFEVQRLFRR